LNFKKPFYRVNDMLLLKKQPKTPIKRLNEYPTKHFFKNTASGLSKILLNKQAKSFFKRKMAIIEN